MLWLLDHLKLKKEYNSLDYFAKIVVAEEIGRGNEIVLNKIGHGNWLRKFAKIVVAEKIGPESK